MRIPYIRITNDKIMLSRAIGYRPEVYNLDTIQEMNVRTVIGTPYKVELLLSHTTEVETGLFTLYRTKVEIYLFSLSKKDKEELIQTLKQVTE